MQNLLFLLTAITIFSSCSFQQAETKDSIIKPGAWQTNEYLPLIKDKRVGLVVNQTSTVANQHLVDTLLALDISIKAIFAPEHGFRGDAYDGEIIDDSIDPTTEIPIISLYASHKKPTAEDLEGIDVMIFDIQDVGARFYTFISTMHYVMEACAENSLPLIILDRPNPNGHYVDGPVLDTAYTSFVGMHPIPIVYGLTNAELARMINGEGWLSSQDSCNVTLVKNLNYTHNTRYVSPIAPSPNLPNARAIELYPSLCLFEPTIISIGRGTDFPFQVTGHPDSIAGEFTFTPRSIDGVSKYPKYQDKLCFGEDLREGEPVYSLDLSFLIDYLNIFGNDSSFFDRANYFDLLAGGDQLRNQLLAGKTAAQIRDSWQTDLEKYMLIRSKYLLYPDFDN
jgi:uncharacterized protein YbbC (DUF1343 family)